MASFSRTEPFGDIADIPAGGKIIRFDTPNELTRMRADSLLAKEPDTIAWLDSFTAGDVFFDIGANVGCYSLYAAMVRAARVFAFEPESQNYALLHRNIFLNDLSERVRAFCIGLSDGDGFTALHLSRFLSGGALHTIGDVDARGRPTTNRFDQGCFTMTLDRAVALGLPTPDHLKIDVDGVEEQVLAGARQTLRAIKSLCVEIAPDARALQLIGEAGLKLREKGAITLGVANHFFER